MAPDGQTTLLELDASDRLVALDSPALDRHTFTYGPAGQLATMKDPKANAESLDEFTFTYVDGRLTSDQDPTGATQTLEYSARPSGFRVVRTSALGRATVYDTVHYSGQQQALTTTTDPAGLSTFSRSRADLTATFASPDAPTDVRYDAFRRLPDGSATYQKTSPDPRFGADAPFVAEVKKLTRADGSGLVQKTETSRTYALASGGLSVLSMLETINTNGRASSTLFERDGGGAGLHRRTMTSAAGRQVRQFENDQGLLKRVEVTGIHPTYFSYDSAGRLVHTSQGSDANCSNPSVTTSTTGCRRRLSEYFDSSTPIQAGFLKSSTDAAGIITAFTRDAAGRTLSETTSSAVTSYAWDRNGNLTSVTPPETPAHSISYTPVNQLSAYGPPAAGVPSPSTEYAYDGDRMLEIESRPGSVSLTRTYDAAGRVEDVSFPGGALGSTYVPAGTTGAGRLQSLTGPYGVDLAFTYDGFLAASTTWSGDVAGSVAWQYNDDFVPTLQTVSGLTGTASTTFLYDDDLFLFCASATTCEPPGSDALVLTRSPDNGQLTDITLGSTSETLTYNGYGELARQLTTFAPSTSLVDITYDEPGFERDALGRIVRKTETIGGTTKTYDYDYDNLRRLTDVTINGTLAEHFEYDANGNRTLGYSAAAGTTHTGTYDDQDRLLSYGPFDYTYTANGELETKVNRDTEDTWLYQYDALGNLVSVDLPNSDLIEYLVDGLGRRVGKKKNGVLLKQWIYKDTLKPAAELDGSGALVSEFVYGSKSNVPDYVRRGGNTYRVISDELGSPRYVVNVANSSDVPFSASYSSFGEVTGTGLDWMPFGFAGGIYDGDTALVRFGARDYEPRAGRWMSRDPAPRASHGFNVFAYCYGDPVNYVDQDGRIPILTWITRSIISSVFRYLVFDLEYEPPAQPEPCVGLCECTAANSCEPEVEPADQVCR